MEKIKVFVLLVLSSLFVLSLANNEMPKRDLRITAVDEITATPAITINTQSTTNNDDDDDDDDDDDSGDIGDSYNLSDELDGEDENAEDDDSNEDDSNNSSIDLYDYGDYDENWDDSSKAQLHKIEKFRNRTAQHVSKELKKLASKVLQFTNNTLNMTRKNIKNKLMEYKNINNISEKMDKLGEKVESARDHKMKLLTDLEMSENLEKLNQHLRNDKSNYTKLQDILRKNFARQQKTPIDSDLTTTVLQSSNIEANPRLLPNNPQSALLSTDNRGESLDGIPDQRHYNDQDNNQNNQLNNQQQRSPDVMLRNNEE